MEWLEGSRTARPLSPMDKNDTTVGQICILPVAMVAN